MAVKPHKEASGTNEQHGDALTLGTVKVRDETAVLFYNPTLKPMLNSVKKTVLWFNFLRPWLHMDF